jgi:hypothetical protein
MMTVNPVSHPITHYLDRSLLTDYAEPAQFREPVLRFRFDLLI